METTVAYEVFVMHNTSYRSRTTVAFFWTKEEAILLSKINAGRLRGRKMRVTKIHLVKIGGNWRRYYVTKLAEQATHQTAIQIGDDWYRYSGQNILFSKFPPTSVGQVDIDLNAFQNQQISGE